MKEVFVLGAGASHVSAGTPLGKDLVWGEIPPLAWEEESKYIKELLSLIKKLLPLAQSDPTLSKYIPQLQALQRKLLRIQSSGCLESIKFFTIDDLMKDLQNLQKEKNEKIIEKIKKLAIKHIAESRNGKGNQLYRGFSQLLSKKSVSEVCVISFNFDCWLCEDIKRERRFDYLLNFDEIDTSRKFYKENQGRGIPLIKWNGSLDWAFDPINKKMKLLHRNIQPETDYYNQANSLNEKVEPYIFLPHQTKDEVTKILRDRAEIELKQASKVTVIGYSFPDCDKEDALKLFQENIESGVEMKVVDFAPNLNKQNEIQNKYKKLFPHIINVKFDFDGFQGYMARWLEKGVVSCQ